MITVFVLSVAVVVLAVVYFFMRKSKDEKAYLAHLQDLGLSESEIRKAKELLKMGVKIDTKGPMR